MNSYIFNINNPFVKRRKSSKDKMVKCNSIYDDFSLNQKFLEQAYNNTVNVQKISLNYAQQSENLYMYLYMMTVDVTTNAEYQLIIRKPMELFNMSIKDLYKKNIMALMFLQKCGLFEEFKFKIEKMILDEQKNIYELIDEQENKELKFTFNTDALCRRHNEFS